MNSNTGAGHEGQVGVRGPTREPTCRPTGRLWTGSPSTILLPGRYIHVHYHETKHVGLSSHCRCEFMGWKMIRPGSDSTDSECEEHSYVIIIVISILILAGLAVGLIVMVMKYKKGSLERYIKPHFMIIE